MDIETIFIGGKMKFYSDISFPPNQSNKFSIIIIKIPKWDFSKLDKTILKFIQKIKAWRAANSFQKRKHGWGELIPTDINTFFKQAAWYWPREWQAKGAVVRSLELNSCLSDSWHLNYRKRIRIAPPVQTQGASPKTEMQSVQTTVHSQTISRWLNDLKAKILLNYWKKYPMRF